MLCAVVVDDPIIFKNNRLPKNNRLIGSSFTISVVYKGVRHTLTLAAFTN